MALQLYYPSPKINPTAAIVIAVAISFVAVVFVLCKL